LTLTICALVARCLALLPLDISAFASALWHMVLPVAMLAFFNTATLTLLMRSNLVDILRNDFIMAARASGLPERRVVLRHAQRNAFIPVLTYLGILFGLMLATAPVTETVFTWPGIGFLYISAIQQLDYPVIMAVSMVVAVMLVIATLLTDIAYVPPGSGWSNRWLQSTAIALFPRDRRNSHRECGVKAGPDFGATRSESSD
jgi:ABC-type dipeptide/oligopeptide/nickel transport system permease component